MTAKRIDVRFAPENRHWDVCFRLQRIFSESGTKVETGVRNGRDRAPATNYPRIGTNAETGVRNGRYRAPATTFTELP